MRQKSLIVVLLLGLAVPNIANAVQFERGDVVRIALERQHCTLHPTGVLKARLQRRRWRKLLLTKLGKFDNNWNFLNNNLTSGWAEPQGPLQHPGPRAFRYRPLASSGDHGHL